MLAHIAVLLASAVLTSSQRGETEKRVGDWTINVLQGFQMASASNDAGASVGILCSTQAESCTAFVITVSNCEEGAQVPMMLNSEVGAGAITTTCRHLPADESGDVTAMNVVTEFDRMKGALESGGTIGIAIPMASGAFRVLRFSTAGATPAIRAAMTIRSGRRQEPNTRPAKDVSEL